MNTFKRKSLFAAILAGLAAAVLPGCASMMSPEQLAASAKAKDANVACATSLPTDLMYINIDKGVVESGELVVQCGKNAAKYTNSRQSPFKVNAP